MKKYIIIAVIVACLLGICIGTFLYLNTPKLYDRDSFKVDGSVCNVNGEFSDLIRKDDKLYYNYYGNIFNSGTYEISSQGSSKKRNADVSFKSFMPTIFMERLLRYKDKVITEPNSDNEFFWVDTKTGDYSSKPAICFNCSQNEEYISENIFDNEIYVLTNYSHSIYKDSDNDFSKLYKYTGEGFKCVYEFNGIITCYSIHKDIVYWVIETNGKNNLYRCDFNSDKGEFITDLDYPYIESLYCGNNSVYICYTNKDTNEGISAFENVNYNFDLLNIKSGKHTNIISKDNNIWLGGTGVVAICYKNNLYVCSDMKRTTKGGLYVYSMNESRLKQLSDIKASNMWVLDNKYVYFSDENKTLYRVTQDGNTTEKVFG